MAYYLSATKLQHYARCPRSYFYKYEWGLRDAAAFGSAALGHALHRALATIYENWHYQEALPPLGWLRDCWEQHEIGLSERQRLEGWKILVRYYEQHIVSVGVLRPPLAVEGRIDGVLTVEGIEFKLVGRYDRLDILEDESGKGNSGGLALIDYKSAKTPRLPEPETVDLQLGLYSLALQQRYQQSLRQMSLLYLRTGEQVTFEASPEHQQQVTQVLGDLALKLRQDDAWQPQCGEGCRTCVYAKYCPAVTAEPESLPERRGKARRPLQLSLGV